MTKEGISLKLLPDLYGVVRLDPHVSIPEWAAKDGFYSITKTSDELSIVCLQHQIPPTVVCERDWQILKVLGPLDFSLVGILASLSTPLALNGISIFAISTYDTDYILVKHKDVSAAIKTLLNEGYTFIH